MTFREELFALLARGEAMGERFALAVAEAGDRISCHRTHEGEEAADMVAALASETLGAGYPSDRFFRLLSDRIEAREKARLLEASL